MWHLTLENHQLLPSCNRKRWMWIQRPSAASLSTSPATSSTGREDMHKISSLIISRVEWNSDSYLDWSGSHLTGLVKVQRDDVGEAAGVPVHGRAAVPKRLEDGVDGLPLLSWGKNTGEKDRLHFLYTATYWCRLQANSGAIPKTWIKHWYTNIHKRHILSISVSQVEKKVGFFNIYGSTAFLDYRFTFKRWV